MELADAGETDPMDEAGWSPVEMVTRRYPDRLIVKVTNMCGMYCRFCQRRRLIGEYDGHATREQILSAVQYVRNNREIRDVLITGGDAFMLEDDTIEWLLAELRSIRHVEIIRFGTRTPVTLPQRITERLASILKKYQPCTSYPFQLSPVDHKESARPAPCWPTRDSAGQSDGAAQGVNESLRGSQLNPSLWSFG
jgi:lysine 2,3-aminomutase